MTRPATPTLPPRLAEVFHPPSRRCSPRKSDCMVVRPDQDHLLRHVAPRSAGRSRRRTTSPGSRAGHSRNPSRGSRASPAVRTRGWMPRPPQPRPTSGPPSSIAKTPPRLKQTSPIFTSSPASFFLGRGFDDRRAGLAAEEERGGIRFRVAADQAARACPVSAIMWLRFRQR